MMNKKIAIIFIVIILLSIVFSLLIINKNDNIDNADEVKFPNVQSTPAHFPPDKTANIVFITDKNYKEYLKVAIKSAVLNKNKDSFYNIYILCVDLSKEDMESYKEFEEDRVKINPVGLNIRMLKNFGKVFTLAKRRVSRADLFKFFIPEIFKDLNKILYLDCDIIVLKDLMEIYNYNLNGKMIGAIVESEQNIQDGFNCGVLLFDIKKSRENKLTSRLVKAKNEDKEKIFVTQKVFNDIIGSNYKNLPINYNYFVNCFDKSKHKKIIILHFLSDKKPWQYDDLINGDIWWKYAKLVNPDWKVEKISFFTKIHYNINKILKTIDMKLRKY